MLKKANNLQIKKYFNLIIELALRAAGNLLNLEHVQRRAIKLVKGLQDYCKAV